MKKSDLSLRFFPYGVGYFPQLSARVLSADHILTDSYVSRWPDVFNCTDAAFDPGWSSTSATKQGDVRGTWFDVGSHVL